VGKLWLNMPAIAADFNNDLQLVVNFLRKLRQKKRLAIDQQGFSGKGLFNSLACSA